MRNSYRRGFTVVELIVVMIVIALLAAIAIVAYGRVQAEARDQKRKTDIVLFADAMEAYYDKNGEYPSGCSTANSASPTTCIVANGVFSGGDSIFQDSTAANMKAFLPTLPADFGGPRGNATKPFASSGRSDGTLMRYIFWGQLNGTVTGGNASAVFGGAYSPAGIDCGQASSTVAIRMPSGSLPKATSFFAAYHSEADDIWYIYQGKHGSGLTLVSSTTPLRGSTLGKCVFVN
jgi:prepilin-type N-terminal cleavage/methylation domain-containing protein